MSIRVFIYDDMPIRRQSLQAILSLSEYLEYVGEAENCSHALRDMEESKPDVVLMDINMPEVDGLEGLKIIKKVYPKINILIQTAYDDDEKVFTAIRSGASGYILKSDQPLRLIQAIQEVNEGGAVMNPAIALKVMEYFNPKVKESPLSPKENEILEKLAQGLSYKMVADELGITYNTVNTYTKRIYEKLHISSLGEAIAWYYKNRV